MHPRLRILVLVAAVVGLLTPVAANRQSTEASGEVTFTKDIAPILQRSCQRCHRPNSVAPMSLITYEDVRPWARSIKTRTGLRWQRGAMPPWFIEKNIGIQKFKDDPSLSDEEVAKIAKWADSGAPRGNPADMPPLLRFDDSGEWTIGKPDLVLKSSEVTIPAVGPDKWGSLGLIPTGLTEDRYVAAIEVREVNNIERGGPANTVGARWGFHHQAYSTVVLNERNEVDAAPSDENSWPVHEVGRNADIFPPEAGRLLQANSALNLHNYHLHSNGRETNAHLEFGFKLFPKDYKPVYRRSSMGLGNGIDIDVKPNQANQQLHAYAVLNEHTKIVTFEPHLHAPGMRMCLEAIWGHNIQTLSCAGYDHNWVRGYAYDDDHAPLLPKGTILHLIGYMDTTPANKNVSDPRNWQGSGNRSVANMFLDLGMKLALTDEQFEAEMAARRSKLKLTRNKVMIGCPLCTVTGRPQTAAGSTSGGNNQ